MQIITNEKELKDKYIKIKNWYSDSEPHMHSFFELMYVTKGYIMHSLNDGPETRIGENEYLFIDYNNFHSYTCHNAEVINIAFSPKFIDKNIGYCRNISHFLTSPKFHLRNPLDISFPAQKILHDESNEILNLIKLIQTQMENRYITSHTITQQLLTAILLIILQPYYEKSFTNNSSLISNELIKITNEHFSESNPLGIAAAALNCSASTLSQQFKKDFKITFKEYLRDIRIEEAKYLLENTKSKISIIGSSVGYKDIKFFTKVFKDLTGLTPSAYRNQLSKSDDIIVQLL